MTTREKTLRDYWLEKASKSLRNDAVAALTVSLAVDYDEHYAAVSERIHSIAKMECSTDDRIRLVGSELYQCHPMSHWAARDQLEEYHSMLREIETLMERLKEGYRVVPALLDEDDDDDCRDRVKKPALASPKTRSKAKPRVNRPMKKATKRKR